MIRLLVVLMLILPVSSTAQTWPVSWEGNDSSIVHNPCGSRYTIKMQPITNASDQAIEVDVTIDADTSAFAIMLGESETDHWTKTLDPGESVDGTITMTALGDQAHTARLLLRVEGFIDSAVKSYTIVSRAPAFKEWPSLREFTPTPVGSRDTMIFEVEATFVDPAYFHVRSTNSAFDVVDDSFLVQMPGTDTFRVAFSPSSEGPVHGELIITGTCFEDSMSVSGIGLAAGVDIHTSNQPLWTYRRTSRSITSNNAFEYSASVKVVDALGSTRIETSLPLGPSQISVAGLASGWYVIQTKFGVRVDMQKILIQ
jgi:hypothetical protein